MNRDVVSGDVKGVALDVPAPQCSPHLLRARRDRLARIRDHSGLGTRLRILCIEHEPRRRGVALGRPLVNESGDADAHEQEAEHQAPVLADNSAKRFVQLHAAPTTLDQEKDLRT